MLVFNNRKERRDWIRRMDKDLRSVWNEYKSRSYLMQEFTPAALMTEMLEKIPSFENKEILVIGNVEFFLYLRTLRNQGKISYKSLTLLTDMKEYEDRPGVIYIPFEEMNKVSILKKFDIVVGNPPFNDSDSTKEGENHRKQSTNLAKQFIYLALELSKEYVSIIGPTSRTYTAGVKKDFIKQGLYEVKDITEYFSGVALSQIVTFTFDKKSRKSLEDCTVFDTPTQNVGQLFKFSTGEIISRKVLEPLLQESGKYKVFVTTGVVKYTDSEEIVNTINDKTRGHYRVVINNVASTNSVGKMHIALPEDVLTYSTSALIVGSVEEGEQLINYLETQEVRDILSEVRTSVVNSAKSFKALPLPF